MSTISLVSVGGAIGLGGLGFVFTDGYSRDLTSEIWAGILAVDRPGRGDRRADRAARAGLSRPGPRAGGVVKCTTRCS